MTQDGTSHGLCACPENAGQKRETTLGTHIARAPERPAARCYGTHAGSNTQRDQWAAGPCKEAHVMPGRGCSETKKCGHTAPHTDSETETVTIEPGCGDTMVMHVGPNPDELQGPVPSGSHTRCMAGEIRRKKNA